MLEMLTSEQGHRGVTLNIKGTRLMRQIWEISLRLSLIEIGARYDPTQRANIFVHKQMSAPGLRFFTPCV